jgi:hypothetical protein
MPQVKVDAFKWTCIAKAAAVAVLWAGCLTMNSEAQQRDQKTFSSPEAASKALVGATSANDEKMMIEILGQEAKQIVASGDDTEDAENRAKFVKKYEEMHRLMREPDGTVVLYVGAENWPTPIPIAHKGNAWFFDTEAGKKEILYRRIGQNEISTIRVCQELVAAQKEYFSTHNEYAQKFFSDEGQHNGLYWKAKASEPQSPIGPLVAAAVSEGYETPQSNSATPYHGYFYRILTAQGKDSPGGAKKYIEDDKMTEGFAFVAYPAEYRSSGVTTFIVNADGVVYEKDLGKQTEVAAKAMKAYNPDLGWRKSEAGKDQTAINQSPNSR